MMTSDIDAIRKAFDLWILSRGKDPSAWLAMVADDIQFSSLLDGRDPGGRTEKQSRRSGLLHYFDLVRTEFDMLEYEIEDYFQRGDRIIALGRSAWLFRSTGRVFRSRTISIFTMREGKITAYENIYDTAGMLETMGLR